MILRRNPSTSYVTRQPSPEAEGYELCVALSVHLTRSIPERLHVSVKTRSAMGRPVYVDRFCQARDDRHFIGADVVAVVQTGLDLGISQAREAWPGVELLQTFEH